MNPTKHDLPEGAREKLCQQLNDRLASAMDLTMQAKTAHWNVKGIEFIALHELFDTVYNEASDWSDLIAERCVMLGGRAQGLINEVSNKTGLAAYKEQGHTAAGHVDALSDALANFSKQMRGAITSSEELNDAGTADMFTEICRASDKLLWFVEAHLQRD